MTYLLHFDSLKNPISLQHPFPKSARASELEIVGSCNGLVCLATNQVVHRICLWNPATKRVKDISNFTIRAVDSTGEVSLGFGFDHVANDYKVVRIVWPSRSMNYPRQVEVYSVNKGCWRQIEVELEFELIHGTCRSIVKGDPYWVGLKDRWENKGTFFLSFDVQNEAFRMIPWPDHIHVVDNCKAFYSMFDFKETFAIMTCNSDDKRKLNVDVCEMDDEGKCSWSKKFSVGPVLGMDRLVGCLRNGEIVGEKSDGNELFVYEPVDNEVKKTFVQMRTFGVYNYIESLVELK